MIQRSFKTLLVLLIFTQVARGHASQSSLLLGTIQFPRTVEAIQDVPVIYHGDPASTQIDQTNHAITFWIPRESSQFGFKLLIVEPQYVEPVSLASKYHADTTNLVAYHKVKSGSAYRFFNLMLVPEIKKDTNGINLVTYSWKVREERIPDAGKIPDDAVIMHAVPDWVDSVVATDGFNFPTVQMKDDLIKQAGSEKEFKERLEKIALARLDLKQFEGKKQEVAMKKVGNTIIMAPPVRAAG